MFRETASDAFVVAARSWACGKPRSGFPSSARAERHVHTHPCGVEGDSDVRGLLLEQVGEEDRVVAFRTGATQSQRPTEEVALRTATLADETLLALRTFVDCVGRESLLAPQLLLDVRLSRGVRRFRSAKPVRELSMGRRTEPGACVCQRCTADQARRDALRCRHRCVTRSVTHGVRNRLGLVHAEHSATAAASTSTHNGRGSEASATCSRSSFTPSSKASTVLARQTEMCRCSVRNWPLVNWPG